MDILDNVMYAYDNGLDNSGNPISSDYLIPARPVLTNPQPNGAGVFAYPLSDRMKFCSVEDTVMIEKSITRHWYDVNDGVKYPGPNPVVFSDFQYTSTYHLMFAYLVENTRILQIFERLLDKYASDEDLGIADNNQVFNWLINSEKLFFKSDYPRISNIRSLVRPSSDSTRRNAYYRLLGMDLAFGDVNSGSAVPYYKAKAANQQFIPLFERYLSEIWQGFMNANNQVGPNTTDINIITNLALQLQDILSARRGTAANYGNRNLSREEFSSVLVTSWFSFIVSYDSPVVNFLGCESSSIGERLGKIGDKVGVPAHKKSQSLFEMAMPASNILCAVETGGVLDNAAWVKGMLTSLNTTTPGTAQQQAFMNDFLSVINNWERATGHGIKNKDVNVTGVLRTATPKPALTLN